MNIPKKGDGRDRSEAARQIDQQAATGLSGSGLPRPIRVLVVDDHPMVRWGVRSYLSGCRSLSIVGEAGNGKEALAKATVLRPDVVLMDIDMPKLGGLAATEILVRENPACKVLMLCPHNDSAYALAISRAGAHGYISKGTSRLELVKAIETVAAGNRFPAWNTSTAGTKEVSPREREVLARIAEGLTNKEIASQLGVGVRTIETHRLRIMRKLKIRSTAGLTKFAISNGLISLSAIRK